MKTVFDAVNGAAAAWDLHVDSDDARAGIVVDQRLTQMQALFQLWDPQTTLHAVVFEENGGLHNMQRALGHATTLNATRRHGDFVLVDCPANCLQPWLQNDNGWDQGQLFFTPDHIWAMPPYYAQLMAARSYQPNRVASQVDGSGDLDVLATRSEDGKTLTLNIVNVGNAALRTRLVVENMPSGTYQGMTWTLVGAPQAVNPPTGPESVHPVESLLMARKIRSEYTFLPHSYTVLQWKQVSAR